MRTPYELVGKRVRVTLYARVPTRDAGVQLVPFFRDGRVSDVALRTDVAREGEPERLLDLVVVTELEGYPEGEAVVPVHDVEVLPEEGGEGPPPRHSFN